MESLILPVTYKGKELEFPLQIVPQGYTYRFIVLIETVEVIFEQDEQGAFRAIANHAHEPKHLPERGLLEAITVVIQSMVG